MDKDGERFNPFPGLRSFEPHEDFLFFGREEQCNELLRRLRRTRFLAVVGTSGCGKSSLVKAGLLPALHGGFMAAAGSSWRVALLRPGSNPLGALAQILVDPDVCGPLVNGRGDEATLQATAETTLRRSTLGLVEFARQLQMPAEENLLIVVDQFEELFRFKDTVKSPRSADDAAAFVELLLQASRISKPSIYIVLTMRSDFLGDCAQFRDLPEAINNGQFLIPRMSRDQRRLAIEGPAAVGGAGMTPRLVQHLLNDLGDDPDQLPILQHALMRTWDKWLTSGKPQPDLPHYEAIGRMGTALSKHADEVFEELADDRRQMIAAKLFKAITNLGADNRGIRRPTRLDALCKVIDATEDEVIPVIDAFRRKGRSFVVPPLETNPILSSDSVVDISHESLMRIWDRLKKWVQAESQSAGIYRRLSETTVLHQDGKAGLWHDPDLQLALDWREQNRPNSAWAARYQPNFQLAMDFLDDSRRARDAEITQKEDERRRELQQAEELAEERAQRIEAQAQAAKRQNKMMVVVTIGLIIAISFAVIAFYQYKEAKKQKEFAIELKDIAIEKEEFARKQEDIAKAQASTSRSREMAAYAWLALDQDPTLSFRLAEAAIKEKPTLLARKAIMPPLTFPLYNFLGKHEGYVSSAVFSPDGKRIVTASDDRTARVWPAGYRDVLHAINVDQIRGVVRQLTDEELERYGFKDKNEQ